MKVSLRRPKSIREGAAKLRMWYAAEQDTWTRRGALYGLLGLIVTVLLGVATLARSADTPRQKVAPLSVRSAAEKPTSKPGSENTTGPRTTIEGTLDVANVTAGDQTYGDEVSARAGDTLKLQAWYYNLEDVKSGLYAAELTVKISLPETRSTSQVASVQIFGANTNVVEDTTHIIVPPHHTLTYVSGSASWRHYVKKQGEVGGHVTTLVDDAIITSGVVLEDASPCLRCEATVTILVRVEPL